MTFAAAIAAADSAALDRLGGAVSYRPQAGVAVSVTGIFDAPYQLATVGSESIESTVPQIFLPAAEVAKLPRDPDEDDPTITRNGVDYKVREVKRDGLGGVLLMLREVDY